MIVSSTFLKRASLEVDNVNDKYHILLLYPEKYLSESWKVKMM